MYYVKHKYTNTIQKFNSIDELRDFAKSIGVRLNQLKVTLPDYPNEKQKRKTCKGYMLFVEKDSLDKFDLMLKDENDIKSFIGVDDNNLKLQRFSVNYRETRDDKVLKTMNVNLKTVPQVIDEEKLLSKISELPILNYIPKKIYPKISNSENILVINSPDLHIGKFGYLKVVREYIKGVEYTISRAVGIEEVILVVGEDVVNVDNTKSTTTKGTQQFNEIDIYDQINVAIDMYIKVIHLLIHNCKKMTVVLSKGNHDKLVSYMIASVLKHSFSKYKDEIDFVIDKAPRTYLLRGKVLLGFSHLDSVDKKNMNHLMSVEVPDLWGKSSYRYMISGHYHHFVAEDKAGILFIKLPSLAFPCEWSSESGFVGATQHMRSMIFSKDRGEVMDIVYIPSFVEEECNGI